VRTAQSADRREPLVGLITALPFASCPVTMRRTSIAILSSAVDVLRAKIQPPAMDRAIRLT